MSREGSLSRTRRLRCLITALIWGIALGCSSAANAASIVQIGGSAGSSLQGLGSFSGSISYTATSQLSTTGALVITLVNTSNAGNGGFITGLLFNIGGGDASSSATLSSASNSFINCMGGGLNAATGQHFEGGAAIGGQFLGAGDPNPGIAIGQSATFTFDITAADAGRLTAIDFVAGGSFEFNFLVRFGGFDDGGPDSIGAMVVPLPPAVMIGVLGLALVSLAIYLKRRAAKMAAAVTDGDASTSTAETSDEPAALANAVRS